MNNSQSRSGGGEAGVEDAFLLEISWVLFSNFLYLFGLLSTQHVIVFGIHHF